MKLQKRTALRLGTLCLALGFLLCSFLSCGACYASFSRYAMGAKFDFLLSSGAKEGEYAAALTEAEQVLSPAFANSLVSRLNRGETVAWDEEPDVAAMFRLGEELRAKTAGAFSLLAGEETALWQFGVESPTLPDSAALALAASHTRAARLLQNAGGYTLGEGKVDVGAAGKGLAVARLAALLEKQGKSGLITAGSTTAAVGDKNGAPWRIGVRDPFSENGGLLGVLSLRDTAVSTSGSYEKCFTLDGVLYHHILDARTGMPADSGLISVTVIVKDPTLADMLSTAAFLLGVEDGMLLCRSYGAEALFVTSSGEVILSEGCQQLFTKSD